jgi:hypothetical protein
MGLQNITFILACRGVAPNIGAFLASVPPNVPLVGVDANRDGTPDMIDRPLPPNLQVTREPATVTKARQRGLRLPGIGLLQFADALF